MAISAQRNTDKLDRGVVAVPANTGGGYLVTWRIFGEEYYGVTYNLYANGSKIASNLNVSNYNHAAGNASTKYQVAAVVNGVEQPLSKEVTPWTAGFLEIPMAKVVDRNGNDVTSQYEINDASLGDVDGDGVTELMVKRNYTGGDLNTTENTTKFHHYECYKLDGTRLWWIDMGPNMMAGPDEQWDIVAFDWDEDGKAEYVLRGADNMIIHTADGVDIQIGNMSYVAPRDEYTRNGNEFLLYLEGATGKPYEWDGSVPKFIPMAYPLPRFETGESDYATVWGKNDTGHRSCKHYLGAPCLDGRHHSIFLGRGCYTRHKMCALDVDPATHKLTQRWRWNEYSGGSPWFGNGYHNFIIADVDEDGRDEIVFGSMVIDDNGKGLSTTGLGHGDAEHCGDFDPYRKGLEFFACNETQPNMNYRNATTSKLYYRSKGTSDDGRGLCGNFTNDFPGCQGRSVNTGLISTVADKEIVGGPATGGSNDALFWSHLNFRIYWTGDLLEGVLDSPGTMREAVVYTPTGGRVFQSSGCALNNSSKNNPCATGDIIGDWREEILARTTDNKYIRVYTTPIATNFRIPTLWHDHEYRNAMVWQCVGYNQPPHTSYFLGQLEGITQAPPPYTMTGRQEIANGGTISTGHNGKQVIVCEPNNTEVSIADGASPYVTFFNVPSWVQGTNSNKTDGTAVINYEYFTCNVTGGALGGNGRVVKQGDGILNLPKVEMKYTGPTDVWAGKVNFDGSLKNSTLWLNRFAELNSDGGTFRCIKMNYASILRPGGDNKVGELTTDSLRLGFGSRVVIDVDNTMQKADVMNVNSLVIETKTGNVWENYGPKYLKPVFEINTGTDDGKLTEGKYKIMTLMRKTGALDNIIIEGINPSQKNYLIEDNGSVYLVIEELRDASDIVWTGANSNVWNLATAENFALESDPQSSSIFVSGDKVTFNDDASKLNVSLDGEIVADSVVVNSSKTYSFSGTGKLIGTTTFVKEGSGTITMGNDNTYTGGNRISGGTVKVSSLSNDTQEYGNLGGVTSAAAKFIIENGGTLMNTANVTMGSPMRMDGDEGGCINAQGTFNMNKIISGTTLTKKGSGSLILFGNNTLKKMIILAGYVDMRAGQAANTIELQGGTLIDNASNTSHAIEVPKGKTATWQLSGTYYLAYANKITGEGTLTINPTNTVSRVRITGNWSQFTGTIKHANTNIWLPLDATTGLPKGTLNIASGCTVTNVCKTFTIGKLTGAGNLAHPVANFQNSTAVTGSNTWRGGNSDDALGDFTYEGKITDGGGTNKANFEKIGTCKMSVKGEWDNTGTVKVTAGTLHTMSKSSLGTGALTVAAGATLSGSGSLKNSSVTIQGKLNPGLNETSPTGNMDFGGKNITVSPTGEIIVCARKCATPTNTGCSYLANIGRMTMNGNVTVIPYAAHELAAGDSIRVWEANTNAGSPKINPERVEIQPGLYWDDSRLNEGLLFVTDVAPVGIKTIETNSEVKAQVISLGGAVLQTVEGRYADIDQIVGKADIPAGVYILRISDGKAVITRKTIKK